MNDLYTCCIAGNLCRVQFSWISVLQEFMGSIFFVDTLKHARMCTYKSTFLEGLIFADLRLTVKCTNIGPPENFLLYIHTDTIPVIALSQLYLPPPVLIA